MAHVTKRKGVKSIIVRTDEDGKYCFHEIDFRAFQFKNKCYFKFEDSNDDMLDELREAAIFNEN